ncbi:MAG: EamA family transporter [Candidatus Lokiarchaeota archaeon]|nr:EamA family transporter [Candidatus Lokiarchaeota archaeon]
MSHQPVKSLRPYLMLAVIILLWGMNYVVSRFLSGIPPIRVSGILYALFRYLLGALTMVVVMTYQKRGPKSILQEIRPYKGILLLSAFVSAMFVIFTHISAEYIPCGTTSIIINLCPIVVLLYGVTILKENITTKKILGFLLGLAGGVIFLWNSLILAEGFFIGILLALGGMFAWAAYTITLHYLEGADRYIVMTVKHTTSTIMIVPFIILMMMDGITLILIWDAISILGLAFAGILASGLAYLLYFAAIEILGAPKASSFLFLVPFVSVAGDFILGEPPTVITLLAGITAIIGVGLIKMSDSQDVEDS